MPTSGEGEATAAAATTSGAGGKFRKIPFRRGHRPTTPYDRPPPSARGINSHNNGSNNSGSLFAKLVVDPAYKLINYGAHHFFASVFRKRLPPTPPQPTVVNGELIDEPHEVVSHDQTGAQMSEGGEFNQPLNSSSASGISELEQVLKQKTFTRSEVDHLIELLQSRAVESSFRVESQRIEEVVSDSGRHPIACGPLEENINEGDRSQGVVSTPIINSRVIDDDLPSPAELAKAYMGSRPSKVSPSMLGTRSLAESGFVTPNSRGRLSIYSMARTPYSRIHPHSIQKGIRLTNIGKAGSSMSSYHSLVEQNEKFESIPLALKRKNSVLDDDLGSVGPIRRIRQKPNLLSSKTSVTASGVESGSGSGSVLVSSKQKLPLIVKPKNSVSKTVGENQDDSNPSASYAYVPSRSSEVAARILRHLEKLTPKEKPHESKLVKLQDKSPLRLTSSMCGRQAVKIKEDVVKPQLLLYFQDGQKMEDTSTAMKNDMVESLKAPGLDSETFHSIVENRVAQPPLEERTLRMSAQEDDGVNCYEIASGPLAEGKIPNDIPFVDNDASATKEPILLKANNQPKAIIPSGHISNKITESGTLGGHMIGLGNGGTVFPPLSAAIQSEVIPHSVDLFGKLKGTKDLPPSSHFSSRTVDKFPPWPSGSSNGMTVLKSENSSSLVNVLPSATGSQLVIPKSDQSGLLHPLKAGDANGKSHTVPSIALNGLNEKAMKLFLEMQFHGFRPSDFTFAALLHACVGFDSITPGHQIHGLVIKTNCVQDIFVGNALLDVYSKHDFIDDMRKFFDDMPQLDGVSYNIMITSYAWNGQLEESMSLFTELRLSEFDRRNFPFATLLSIAANRQDLELGRQIHSQAYMTRADSEIQVANSLVDMYAKCGRFDEANIIFGKLVNKSSVPWTAIISAYVQKGLNDEALKLFNEMRKYNVSGDQATFASTLRASSNLALLSLGKQLHSSITRTGFMSNVFCGSALLDMYGKCGSIKDAVVIFEEMPDRNTVSWNALISAYAQNGYGKSTTRSFKEMIESGLSPDPVSFLCVLRACSHRGLVDEALQYFNSMTETYKLVPRKDHYASLVDVLCRRGRFKEAETIMAQMPFEPDEIMWSSVLNSCRIHKNQDFAKRAADELFNMDVLRDAAAYVTMSNIYAEAGDWQQVAKVKKAMRERGVHKVPAYSWVEIQRKVHVFTANDRTHPLNEDIRKKINSLEKRMEEEGYRPDLSCSLQNVDDEIKAESLKYHSERLAIAFALLSTPDGSPILVLKNLRACFDCHAAIKAISKVVRREITVRDSSRFHHFKDGLCSCGDYW